MPGSARQGRVLVVTNDFPPRRGGIESFVYSLCQGLPADRLVVYTASMPGSAYVDGAVDYPVVRDEASMLLPTPRVARAVQEVARARGCDRVVFGAAAPLGLLAAGLRRHAGVTRVVALTHGHEVGWAHLPGARRLLRRVGENVDVLTYVSEYCRHAMAPTLGDAVVRRMTRLSPGVDVDRFRPGADGHLVRTRAGIPATAPVVLAASRLVARKGQDMLIRVWPRVLERFPEAVLLVVGDGPARARLHSRARGLGPAVRFLPGVEWAEMPPVYAAADVFALPCRTRLAGLEPEALGIVYLEAAAAGLPVVVGSSGGAPETVVDQDTGLVVDGRSPAAVTAAVTSLLADPGRSRAMGERGRSRVREKWQSGSGVATLRALLDV